MSARAIREATGKRLLNEHLASNSGAAKCRFASIDEQTDWDTLQGANPWLNNEVSFIHCKDTHTHTHTHIFMLYLPLNVQLEGVNKIAGLELPLTTVRMNNRHQHLALRA